MDIRRELAPVHVPELDAAYPGVLGPDRLDEAHYELLHGAPAEFGPAVMLVICLLAPAKQHAEGRHSVARCVPRAQVPYCLAPAFFRIGIPNLDSATRIISS